MVVFVEPLWGFWEPRRRARIASADAQHPTDQSQGGAQQPLARLKRFRPGSPSRSFLAVSRFLFAKPTRNSAYTGGSRWYLRCILAASTLVYVCLRVEAKRPCKGKGASSKEALLQAGLGCSERLKAWTWSLEESRPHK